MAKNGETRPETARIRESASAWIDDWVKELAQDRTTVLRAGVTLLILLVEQLQTEEKAKLIAHLNNVDYADVDQEWQETIARAAVLASSRAGGSRAKKALAALRVPESKKRRRHVEE